MSGNLALQRKRAQIKKFDIIEWLHAMQSLEVWARAPLFKFPRMREVELTAGNKSGDSVSLDCFAAVSSPLETFYYNHKHVKAS